MCVFVGHTYIPHTEAPPYTVVDVTEVRMATIVVVMLILGCFVVLSQCKCTS